ncbi:MAG: SynChlorMet cassette protein ScmD [Methanotrichaceae archaeon]|nr:SynChlorMet cassette protein ScmD [Methanotrichaceae archaeon]
MHECSLPTINPQVVCREEFDGWAILFDPDSGKAFGINPVAVRIWKNLDGKTKKEDILQELKSSFSEVPENIESDFVDFVRDLVEKGFAGYEV